MGRWLMRKSESASQAVHVLLSVARDVSCGVIGSYVYDKLTRRKSGKIVMTIRNREIAVNQGEIIHAIEEEIKIEKDTE